MSKLNEKKCIQIPNQAAEKEGFCFKPFVVNGNHQVTSEEFLNKIEETYPDGDPFENRLLDGAKCETRMQGSISNIAREEPWQKARKILQETMGVSSRNFCIPLSQLCNEAPIHPQKQNDYYINFGVPMARVAIKGAIRNVNQALQIGTLLNVEDINVIATVSHNPYPFPAFTNYLISDIAELDANCKQLPCNSMGCAGGAYGLGVAYDHLKAYPGDVVVVLTVELSSLGFRPHKRLGSNPVSWFLNSGLFGDAVTATICLGSEKMRLLMKAKINVPHTIETLPNFNPGANCFSFLLSRHRCVKNTMHVSYFEYDEHGYNFVTTGALCDVAAKNAPDFIRDMVAATIGPMYNTEHQPLPEELHGKEKGTHTGAGREEKILHIIHPGGAKMVDNACNALNLWGSQAEAASRYSLFNGGNVASSTVPTMLSNNWELSLTKEAVTITGMGPGFVLTGVVLKPVDSNDIKY